MQRTLIQPWLAVLGSLAFFVLLWANMAPRASAAPLEIPDAYLTNYRFLGVSGSVTATGYFVDSAGRRLGDPAGKTVLAANGTNAPKSFSDLWVTLPTGAVGWIGSFDGAVYYDTGTTSTFTTGYSTGFQTIPANMPVVMGRISWPYSALATAAGSNHTGEVGMHVALSDDSFARPADTTAYSANDRVSATTSNTGTTVLRTAFTALSNGGAGYITGIRLWTNNVSSWTVRFRVHLYTVNAPTTAIVGDNTSYAVKAANFSQRIGAIDLPAMSVPAGTGTDVSSTGDETLRIPYQCATGDNKIYYALEIIDAATPTSGQTFYVEFKHEDDR